MNRSDVNHDADGFVKRLNGETPRSRILLSAGFIEELLRAAILKRLTDNASARDLFGEKSTLGLSQLAKYAHALGLIGDVEIAALKRFADVRNMIAHSWKADFTDPKIQKISEEIQIIKVLGEGDLPPHQRCFARLDYLGLYLTEQLFNRFYSMPSHRFLGEAFLSSIIVDPATGARTMKTTNAP